MTADDDGTQTPAKREAEPALLAEPYASDLEIQDYGGGDEIDGVAIQPVNRHVDDGGSFQEIARLTDDGRHEAFPDLQVRQINYSIMHPDAIKAFHLHREQEDLWFVPAQSRLLVGLHDCRKGSPTEGTTMRFSMGDGRAQLLHIPRGVAHGVKNIGQEEAVLMYFVNQQFDPEDPDEGRLDWDMLGEEFWEMDRR